MRRTLTLPVALVGSSLIALPAFAQDEEAEVRYKKKTEIDFEDVSVDGELEASWRLSPGQAPVLLQPAHPSEGELQRRDDQLGQSDSLSCGGLRPADKEHPPIARCDESAGLITTAHHRLRLTTGHELPRSQH